MAYYTGGANNVASLFSALQNACTANGWAFANNIFSKNGCFVKATTSTDGIVIIGGTGGAGGVLTGDIRLFDNRQMPASLSGINENITYPLTYHIHVIDLEVYLFVNYNIDSWSYIAFGQSPVAGTKGTGNWYGGVGNGAAVAPNVVVNSGAAEGRLFSMLFSYIPAGASLGNSSQPNNCFFHHGLNSQGGWSCTGYGYGDGDIASTGWSGLPSQAAGSYVTYPLLNRQPNNWNNEAILLPITPCIEYKSKITRVIVGDLQHARYVRIDNYEPGQIITLGHDKWKIYPFLKKNTVYRDGQSYSGGSPVANVQHSGTFGIAIRYDGA